MWWIKLVSRYCQWGYDSIVSLYFQYSLWSHSLSISLDNDSAKCSNSTESNGYAINWFVSAWENRIIYSSVITTKSQVTQSMAVQLMRLYYFQLVIHLDFRSENDKQKQRIFPRIQSHCSIQMVEKIIHSLFFGSTKVLHVRRIVYT